MSYLDKQRIARIKSSLEKIDAIMMRLKSLQHIATETRHLKLVPGATTRAEESK